MKLYTRTGDRGETSLANGTRVRKDHPRVIACGQIDELSAMLGWCRGAAGDGETATRLGRIQRALLAIGAELADPQGATHADYMALIATDDGRQLEHWIDEAVEGLPPLHNFLLAGGTELACRLHVARACCRRAERAVVSLEQTAAVRGEVLVYLNRLGDLLFAWARRANHEAGLTDLVWTPKQ